MFKQWTFSDNRKDDYFQGDSKSSYTGIEAPEIRDNVNKIDFARPLRNVFEDIQHTNSFVEQSSIYSLGNENGVIKHSLVWAFSGDTNDIETIRINPGSGDTIRVFSRLKPGVAYLNGNIVVSRPQTHIAERQIAKILRLDDWKDEGVNINYFYNTDLYQAKVIMRDVNGLAKSYYFTGKTGIYGDSAKWGDSRYGYHGALKLFEAMYNGDSSTASYVSTFRPLFRTSLADSIYRIYCEPYYKLPNKWTGDTIYWKISSTGRIYGDSKIPIAGEFPLQAYRFQVAAQKGSVVGGSRGDSRLFIQNSQDFYRNIYLNVPQFFGDTSSYGDSKFWADSQGMMFTRVSNQNAGMVIYRQNAGVNSSAFFGWMETSIPGILPAKSQSFFANKDIAVSRWTNAGDTLGRAWASVMSMSGDSWTFFGDKQFRNGSVYPGISGQKLGTATNRWKVFADSISVSNSLKLADTLFGNSTFSLLPTTTTIYLGNVGGTLTYRGDSILGKTNFVNLFPSTQLVRIGTANASPFNQISLYADTLFVGKPTNSVALSYAAIQLQGTTQFAGAFYGGTTAPFHSNRTNYDGYLYATVFQSTSSREYKRNIKNFKINALDIINDVKVVEFNFREDADKKYNVGFIAEDTHEILAGKNHDMMDMNNTIGVLIKAVQEVDKKVEKLKTENKNLKDTNKLLEKKVSILEKRVAKSNATSRTKLSRLIRFGKK